MNDLLYIGNLIFIFGTFIVTIYRAWIERKQMRAIQKLNILNEILEREKDQIENMTGEEFIDMLRTILG